MGKAQRDKGYRTENNLRNLLIEKGIKCRRVPLSGAVEGDRGDLLIEVNGVQALAEVKCRGDGFKQDYQWLEEATFLFKKADRRDTLVTMRIGDFIKLVNRQVES